VAGGFNGGGGGGAAIVHKTWISKTATGLLLEPKLV